MNDIEIYIHIPFCAKKCAYCDFASAPALRSVQNTYMHSLIKEISSHSDLAKDCIVRSIFIGGGTPSLIDETHICNIMGVLRERYNIKKDAEITIESNPCTLTQKKLDAYIRSGINRISIGCQSTDNDNLKLLGRLHDFETFIRSYEETLRAGFKNINVDMIYALPNQSVCEWESELRIISSLNISHISAYSLILEEGTPLYEMRDSRIFPNDDEAAQMYDSTEKILSSVGFHRYEISNYAKDGFECIHNIGYWQRVPYLGFGLAAASLFDETRRTNTSDMREYVETFADDSQKTNSSSETKLTKSDAMSEFMFLGLRMIKGVSQAYFKNKFGCDIFDVFGAQLDKNIKIGALECAGDKIFIPEKYLFVSNSILSDFV